MKFSEVLENLDGPLARQLEDGGYAAVATALEAAGRDLEAGVLWEATWDFPRAAAAFARAGADLHALRCALEADDPALADQFVAAIAQREQSVRDEALALLTKRRRPNLVAALVAHTNEAPTIQSAALSEAGDILGAARSLAAAGEFAAALATLQPVEPDRTRLDHLALAASLYWETGDVERAARLAQAALRRGADRQLSTDVLAPCLAALGHGLAADIARQRGPDPNRGPLVQGAPVRHAGRYQVQKLAPHALTGRAVFGFDRVEQREVEIHDLLADIETLGSTHAQATQIVGDFIEYAAAAFETAHPALRPILWTDAAAGLMVLGRGSTTTLRALIRPPGLSNDLLHVRAMVLFLLGGLAQAHDRGFVHGAILPSLIVFDPAERPLLNPFGMNLLSSLVATRTGSLDELLTLTAPEVKAGETPTAAADIFAIGQIYAALLQGTLPADLEGLPASERALIESMTVVDPELRPSARQVIARLEVPRTLTHRLTTGRHAVARLDEPGSPAPPRPITLDHVTVTAHPSWSDDELATLCRQAPASTQPILDRRGRTFYLAPWPDGCATFDGSHPVAALVKGELLRSLETLDDAIFTCVHERLRPQSVVQTAEGVRMLALDDLLARAPNDVPA